MCRFAAYLGQPLLISQLVTEPSHSLIHQSYHSIERKEPLNGDGFGVAWFTPEISPRPALFKDITPAWNNENLRELARVTRTRCMLAHVRAASPESPVHRLNCHPFSAGPLAFMHNGYLAQFATWRRRLLEGLSDPAFAIIRGSTDSEHAFAVFWDFYRTLEATMDPGERLVEGIRETIRRLESLKAAAGVSEASYFNFAVSDGERLVACRHASDGELPPPSLHFTVARDLRCVEGEMRMDNFHPDPDFVVIASEEIMPGFEWTSVAVNQLLLASHPGQVEVRPISL